jgi:hypothetical protein
MDEIVVLSTSKAIHEEREPITPTYVQYVSGVLKLSGGYIDKRPFLYAAYVALFHDAFGFSPQNAFYANMLLGAITLYLVWVLGSLLGRSHLAGNVSMVAFSSVPLFAQNVTGGGIDVINITCILVLLLCCVTFLRSPTIPGCRLLIGAAVLLAYARYESLIYLAIPFICLCVVYRLRGRFYIDVTTSLYAVGAVPLLGIHFLTFSNPAAWFQFADKGVTKGFSTDFISHNVGHALNFFLNTEHTLCNSPLVFVVGLLAFLLAVVSMARRRRWGDFSAIEIGFWSLALISVSSMGLLMCYSWGELDQPVGSRLSLPFYLFLALSIAFACREYVGSKLFMRGLTGLFLVGIYWSVPPLGAKNYAEKLYASATEIALMESFNANQPDRRFAVISGYTNYWLTRDVYCVNAQSLASNPDFLKKMKESGEFRRIYVVQFLEKDAVKKDFKVKKGEELPAGFELEIINEDAALDRKVRISEVLGFTSMDEMPPSAK